MKMIIMFIKIMNTIRVYKTISLILAILLFIGDGAFSYAERSTISPELGMTHPQTMAKIHATLICELIEERAKLWSGKSIEEIYTDDMLLWQNSQAPYLNLLAPILSVDKAEINIEIPYSDLTIRYYDATPEKNNTLISNTDWSKTKTEIINDKINRQIIKRIAAVSSFDASKIQLRKLTQDFAFKNMKKLTELYNKIEGVNWVPEQIASDMWAKGTYGLKEDRIFYGKWEHSYISVDKNENIVGLLLAYERPKGELEGVDEVSVYIHGMVVDDYYRRYGVATGLMHMLASDLEDNGYLALSGGEKAPSICLQTGIDNVGAKKFYKKMGFEIVGTKKYPEHDDFVLWAKAEQVLNVKGPAVIMMQTVNDLSSLDALGKEYINGNYIPGGFDDTNYFKDYKFIYDGKYAPKLSNEMTDISRRTFREFCKKYDIKIEDTGKKEDEELISETKKLYDEKFNSSDVKVKALRIKPGKVGVSFSLSKNTKERSGLQYEKIVQYRKKNDGSVWIDNKTADTLRDDLLEFNEHKELFEQENRDKKVFAYSGYGNLIMDGYLSGYTDGELIIRSDEPAGRIYSSCVVFSDGRIEFMDIKYTNDEPIDVKTGNALSVIDPGVQIISGQSVPKKGTSIKASEIIDQFYNIKHLLHLPYIGGDVGTIHFGVDQLNVNKRLLEEAVKGGPVTLKLEAFQMNKETDVLEKVGVPVDILIKALEEKAYTSVGVSKGTEVQSRGQFFINEKERSITICFYPAINAHHFVGMDFNGDFLDILIQGKSNQLGLSLEDAGEWLENEYGLVDAIVIDNGGDVMMNYRGEMTVASSEKRKKIASVIIYHKPREDSNIMRETFFEASKATMRTLVKESSDEILLRVPVEAIEAAGKDNIKRVISYLNSFQGTRNGYIELFYMTGTRELGADERKSLNNRFNIKLKMLPVEFEKTNKNTVTLFTLLKGQEYEISDDPVQAKRDMNRILTTNLGYLEPQKTQIVPVGLQNDVLGILRSAVMGLQMIHIARYNEFKKDLSESIDKEFIARFVDPAVKKYEALCTSCGMTDFDFTGIDFINLASGNFNDRIRALKKLIDLLPIEPLDPEEIRRIYEHAELALISA